MSSAEGLISQREATALLRTDAGLGERHARRLLAAGFAGPATGTRGARLYAGDRVAALGATTSVTDTELDRCCPHGLFVARRDIDLTQDRDRLVAALTDGWLYSPWTAVWLIVRIKRHGAFPLVATVGSFVVLGADIVQVTTGGQLRLREPGPWFGDLAHRRLTTGPGREWWVRGLDRPR
jgi:hypothetical protein